MKLKKKICLLFSVIIMFMFSSIVNVKAATLVANPTKVNVSTNSRDYTFTVTFSGTTNNEWKLSYDSEVYPSGTNPISNGKLSVDAGSITFAVKKNLKLTEDKPVKISVTNENSEEVVATSITILKNQTVTSSTTKSTTKAPTTTTTKQEAPKSNNANLKTLEIIGSDDSSVILSPDFSSSVYEYSATVDASVKTVTINATMEDPKSNMVISNNATEELKAGENNKITIKVMAEDGITTKAYVINIKREALTADATLSSLTIKECKDFKLKADKFSYDVKIGSSVTKLSIDYVTSVEKANVSISGNENLKDGSKVKILVTAEDGTKKEYVLNIVKTIKTTKKTTQEIEAEKNPLIIMALSMVAFGLIGGIVYVIKK